MSTGGGGRGLEPEPEQQTRHSVTFVRVRRIDDAVLVGIEEVDVLL